MKESDFQHDLIKEIESTFSGSIVMKADSSYIQGIPDLLIFYNDKWASLECKKSAKEKPRPNQPYYVKVMNSMAYSSFVYPENKEEVINELSDYFYGARSV